MSTPQKAINLPSWWSRNTIEVRNTCIKEIKKRFDSKNEKSIISAMKIAEKYHESQYRADGDDYIVHPIRVCISLMIELNIQDIDLIKAAFLHDVLEDTLFTIEQIEEQFEKNTAKLVNTLTRNLDEKRPKIGDSLENPYYKRIVKNGKDSILLKCADKLDNMRDSLNHPKLEKRKIYLRECQTIFLPLLKKINDSVLEETFRSLFIEAMRNHSVYIDQLLLFNPSLESWVTRDDVQIVETPLSANFPIKALVNNVITAIKNKIENDQIDSLVFIANLPAFLNDPGKSWYWQRIKAQLQILSELLYSSRPPQWLKPIIDSPDYLLAVIHSRLFMPANWLFTLWQRDYGDSICKSNFDYYKILHGKKIADKWMKILSLCLTQREALWRYQTCRGAYSANIVLSEIIKASKSQISDDKYLKLISARLLTEYLDIKIAQDFSNKNIEGKFNSLWKQLKERQSDSLPSIFLKFTDKDSFNLKKSEIKGFHRILTKFSKFKSKLNILMKILLDQSHITMKRANDSCVWIVFNNTEIEKRKALFQNALKRISARTTFGDLQKIGINIEIDTLNEKTIYTVEPDKWDALKNRLVEVTDREREEIRSNNYSAESMFDTLLTSRLYQDVENKPIWIPRVYRIIDTMADFDQENIQKITVSFSSEEKIKNAVFYLPIPLIDNSNISGFEKKQDDRKNIIARYIAVTIYNHVVTLGIYSATVDCSPVDHDRAQLGFTGYELEEKINAAAIKYKYEQVYGSFIENFNFNKFSIKSGINIVRSIPFEGNDISYGNFIGIDVGGTDTKVCFFKCGDIASDSATLVSFATFESNNYTDKISVKEFCRRIISKIEENMSKNFSWGKLNGVGLSWPGAVKNSKIVAQSGVLQRLTFMESGDTISINPSSSPRDIHAMDLVAAFKNELRSKSDKANVTIENDGNAEAYGNYCHLLKTSKKIEGGKLIIKLGTSVAGGHIDSYGAVSQQVTEFSKIIMDFRREKSISSGISGPAREFIPSKGVRNLSRVFRFNGKSVFGSLKCKHCNDALNNTDDLSTRVEAIEIGQMLNFLKYVGDDKIVNDFFNELIKNNNEKGDRAYKKLQKKLANEFKTNKQMQNEFRQYIKNRGTEEFERVYKEKDKPKTNGLIWQLGLMRTRILLDLEPSTHKIKQKNFPINFEYNTFAEKIMGSVALLSQLALHVSHLVVQLFNIYKKERFHEVILAGGVLRGETGELVIRQTEAFLAKFYDKIFGPTKHLKPGSIRIALSVDRPDTVGPFGAAMIANRAHKVKSIALMEKEIDYHVSQLHPGYILSIKDVTKKLKASRADDSDIKQYVESLVAKGILLQVDDTGNEYMKTLTI